MASLRSRSKDIAVRVITRSNRLTEAVIRTVGAPRLFELYETAASWSTTAEGTLEAAFGIEPEQSVALVDEARHAMAEIPVIARGADRAYPEFYAVEQNTAFVLYAAVRAIKPAVVLETGVADGVSTALMLSAMEVNGVGQLHSIDIAGDVGAFVKDARRWTLHIVDPSDANASAVVIASLPALDLFLHDGNHERAFQESEYAAAWAKLGSGGVLISDDIDWSYAFVDFVVDHEQQAAMLMDHRKVLGIVRKP